MQDRSYITVTEIPDGKASEEQLARLYTRYRFAAEFCHEKEVLEVACGAGIGLGYLARKAKKVIGGDYDEKLVQIAKDHYQDRVEVRQLDAHNLPFDDKSFDVAILYEAIYYLERPEAFVKEARRVLRDGGLLIICTVNKEWEDFNPSPYSLKYFSVPELYELLRSGGFADIALYGDCKVNADTTKDKIVSAIKKTAVKFHLMPKTMKGKEFLKRIFMGKLVPLPPEITDGMSEYIPPSPIDHIASNVEYKVLFALTYPK